MWDALGFGIMCGCKMNVRTRQNRLGRGVRRGCDGVGAMHWGLSLFSHRTSRCTRYLSNTNADRKKGY